MVSGKIKKKILRSNNPEHRVFILRITNYSPSSILFRILFNSVVAILIVKLMLLVVEGSIPVELLPQKHGPIWPVYLRVILFFNVLSELIIIADIVLEYFFPIPKKIRLRVLLQFTLSLVLIVLMMNVTIWYRGGYEKVLQTTYFFGVAIGLVFITIISTSLLLMRLTEVWIDSQREIDIMKQEKLKMDYNALQDKLNPHFLFNNLSVLKSLIIYDQDTAIKFTEDFTDVYRYVLESKDKVLVRLIDELEFIDAYIGLHKERLGKGLDFKTSISKKGLDMEIAPLTIQLLIENAIKHNIASKDLPLSIELIVKDDFVGVINSLQLKEASYSTKTGLKNLVERYKMLTTEKIEIIESDKEFMVKVPLI